MEVGGKEADVSDTGDFGARGCVCGLRGKCDEKKSSEESWFHGSPEVIEHRDSTAEAAWTRRIPAVIDGLRLRMGCGEFGAAWFFFGREFHEFDASLVGVVEVELPFAVAA